jgi:hypothetical protein
MSSLPSILAIPSIGKALEEDGTSNEPWIDKSAVKLLEEFEWYATALKAKRDADGVPS